MAGSHSLRASGLPVAGLCTAGSTVTGLSAEASPGTVQHAQDVAVRDTVDMAAEGMATRQ